MAAKKARSKKYSGLLSTRAKGASAERPWRPLAALGVVLIALYATMLGVHATHPRLAIDLAGGTSAVFTAETDKGTVPSAGDMDQAVAIMQERVNGYGVSEATVNKEGSNTIDVEIPGQYSQATVNSIGATAHLYFRPVLAATTGVPTPTTSPTPGASGSATPKATGSAAPSATASSSAKASSPATANATASEKATGQSESGTVKADAASTSASPDAGTSAKASSAATGGASTSPHAGASPSATSSASAQEQQAVAQYEALDCSNKASLKSVGTVKSTDYLATCGIAGDDEKYLLGPSVIDGKDVTSAIATQTLSGGMPTGAWEVDLGFDAKGKQEFATETTALYQQVQGNTGTGRFAITLDGIVESAPVVQGAITGGTATINGSSFNQATAKQLATTLDYGSLPLNFKQSQVSIVSPTLGSSELQGGLIAGGIGLLLVFLYVIMYYRGLSVAAISSLVVAAALTYALACLFGPLMGFTLSLPGVAGLIVAIGITADSFVVFFERLRDELREGRSVRSAVRHAWQRARRTVIASDMVTLIAAVVLYLLTVGSVQGFAFTLGLSTIIDLAVIFLFTVPLVTFFSRTNFYGNGHPWSGLDPESMGRARQNHRSATRDRMTITERRRLAEEQAAAEAGTDESNQQSVEA